MSFPTSAGELFRYLRGPRGKRKHPTCVKCRKPIVGEKPTLAWTGRVVRVRGCFHKECAP